MHGSSCTQDHEEFFISPSWYCSDFQSLLVYSRKVLGAQRGPWSCAKRHRCQLQNVPFTTQASVVQTEISKEPGFQDETPTQIHPLMAPSKRTTTTHRSTDARRTSTTQHPTLSLKKNCSCLKTNRSLKRRLVYNCMEIVPYSVRESWKL